MRLRPTQMRRSRNVPPPCLAVVCLCVAMFPAEASFWRTPFFRRSLADRTAPAALDAGTDCAARGFLVSLWHAPSGSDAAAALRSSVGGAPDSQFVTQNLTFGLDSVTGAGVPIAAQAWPEGYVGHPFISTFATYLRAPYDGIYRFYITADDVTNLAITSQKGAPASIQTVGSSPEAHSHLQTTAYETNLSSGHYTLSLAYAKTDVSSQPQVRLEWEYPERSSAAPASLQPGRIIPRSMVYKRDAFLNKCSMPAAGAALAPAGEAQIKGPKLPQPLAQASAQPPQLAATQGDAPSTAPSVAAAPSNTLTSWMPASWGGLSDKPLAHSLAPVSQPSMEPIASKRLPSVSLPAQGVAPKPSGVAAAPGPAPASGPGGSVREKVAASVAVPGSAWEAATPLRPSAGPSASFPELLPGKSAAGSGLRETAGTDSFSTKDSSEVVPASGPRSEAMVPSKPVEATPQTVSQTVYASQPTLAASRAEFPAAVPFLAPASVGPNAASPEGVYSTALEAATASATPAPAPGLAAIQPASSSELPADNQSAPAPAPVEIAMAQEGRTPSNVQARGIPDEKPSPGDGLALARLLMKQEAIRKQHAALSKGPAGVVATVGSSRSNAPAPGPQPNAPAPVPSGPAPAPVVFWETVAPTPAPEASKQAKWERASHLTNAPSLTPEAGATVQTPGRPVSPVSQPSAAPSSVPQVLATAQAPEKRSSAQVWEAPAPAPVSPLEASSGTDDVTADDFIAGLIAQDSLSADDFSAPSMRSGLSTQPDNSADRNISTLPANLAALPPAATPDVGPTTRGTGSHAEAKPPQAASPAASTDASAASPSAPAAGPGANPSAPAAGPKGNPGSPASGPAANPDTPAASPDVNPIAPAAGPGANPSAPASSPDSDPSAPAAGPNTAASASAAGSLVTATPETSAPHVSPADEYSGPVAGLQVRYSWPASGPKSSLSLSATSPETARLAPAASPERAESTPSTSSGAEATAPATAHLLPQALSDELPRSPSTPPRDASLSWNKARDNILSLPQSWDTAEPDVGRTVSAAAPSAAPVAGPVTGPLTGPLPLEPNVGPTVSTAAPSAAPAAGPVTGPVTGPLPLEPKVSLTIASAGVSAASPERAEVAPTTTSGVGATAPVAPAHLLTQVPSDELPMAEPLPASSPPTRPRDASLSWNKAWDNILSLPQTWGTAEPIVGRAGSSAALTAAPVAGPITGPLPVESKFGLPVSTAALSAAPVAGPTTGPPSGEPKVGLAASSAALSAASPERAEVTPTTTSGVGATAPVAPAHLLPQVSSDELPLAEPLPASSPPTRPRDASLSWNKAWDNILSLPQSWDTAEPKVGLAASSAALSAAPLAGPAAVPAAVPTAEQVASAPAATHPQEMNPTVPEGLVGAPTAMPSQQEAALLKTAASLGYLDLPTATLQAPTVPDGTDQGPRGAAAPAAGVPSAGGGLSELQGWATLPEPRGSSAAAPTAAAPAEEVPTGSGKDISTSKPVLPKPLAATPDQALPFTGLAPLAPLSESAASVASPWRPPRRKRGFAPGACGLPQQLYNSAGPSAVEGPALPPAASGDNAWPMSSVEGMAAALTPASSYGEVSGIAPTPSQETASLQGSRGHSRMGPLLGDALLDPSASSVAYPSMPASGGPLKLSRHEGAGSLQGSTGAAGLLTSSPLAEMYRTPVPQVSTVASAPLGMQATLPEGPVQFIPDGTRATWAPQAVLQPAPLLAGERQTVASGAAVLSPLPSPSHLPAETPVPAFDVPMATQPFTSAALPTARSKAAVGDSSASAGAPQHGYREGVPTALPASDMLQYSYGYGDLNGGTAQFAREARAPQARVGDADVVLAPGLQRLRVQPGAMYASGEESAAGPSAGVQAAMAAGAAAPTLLLPSTVPLVAKISLPAMSAAAPSSGVTAPSGQENGGARKTAAVPQPALGVAGTRMSTPLPAPVRTVHKAAVSSDNTTSTSTTSDGPLDAAADFLSLPESLTAGLARMLPNADRAAKQTEAKPTETKSFLDIPRPKLLRAQDAIPQPRSSSFVSRALDRLRLPSLPDADLPLSNPVRDFLSSSGPN